jgi:hypothetical protein
MEQDPPSPEPSVSDILVQMIADRVVTKLFEEFEILSRN